MIFQLIVLSYFGFLASAGNSTTLQDLDEPLLSSSSVNTQSTSDTIPVTTKQLAEGTSTEKSISNETNTGIVPTTMLNRGISTISAGIKTTEYVSTDTEISTTTRTQATTSLETITSSTPHTASTTHQTDITTTKQPTTSEKTESTSQITSVKSSTLSMTSEPTSQTDLNTSSTSAAEASHTEPISVSMTDFPSTRDTYNSTPSNGTLSTTAYATSRVTSADEIPLTTYTSTNESIPCFALTTISPLTSSNSSVPIAICIVIAAAICITAGYTYSFIKKRSKRRNQRSNDNECMYIRESDCR